MSHSGNYDCMSQFFRDSISFHRLHSKTCLAVISVFNSLNLCLGVQVSVPHDFLTFARLQGLSYLCRSVQSMSVSAHHEPPTTVGFPLLPLLLLLFFFFFFILLLLSLIFLYALLHDFLLLNLLNVVQRYSEQLLQFFGGDSDASSPKNDTETGKELKSVNDIDKY